MSNLHPSFRSLLSLLLFLLVAGLLHAAPTEVENNTRLITYHQSSEHLTLKTNEVFFAFN